MQSANVRPVETETGASAGPAPAHKPMTAAQNVALTIKIILIAAVLGGLLWLLDAARN
ncbi:MAG: hypothetical protein JSU00_09990 [Acidobacteria bacterium]|nr:hypothetical protein [Acidobacteriota bacterium]